MSALIVFFTVTLSPFIRMEPYSIGQAIFRRVVAYSKHGSRAIIHAYSLYSVETALSFVSSVVNTNLVSSFHGPAHSSPRAITLACKHTIRDLIQCHTFALSLKK